MGTLTPSRKGGYRQTDIQGYRQAEFEHRSKDFESTRRDTIKTACSSESKSQREHWKTPLQAIFI